MWCNVCTRHIYVMSTLTTPADQGNKPGDDHLERPRRQLHATHRTASCAQRGRNLQIVTQRTGAWGVEAWTCRRRGDLFLHPPATWPHCDGLQLNRGVQEGVHVLHTAPQHPLAAALAMLRCL